VQIYKELGEYHQQYSKSVYQIHNLHQEVHDHGTKIVDEKEHQHYQKSKQRIYFVFFSFSEN